MAWAAFALLAGLLGPAGPAVATEAATAPCRMPGLTHEVRCGHVSRPLDAARPQGRSIAVHYVVVPALARGKQPDPVFLLAGGPGQSAVDAAASVWPLFARLNQRRDIVFVDQRGTGRSELLACDGFDQLPLAERTDLDAVVRRLHDCRDTLAARVGRDGLAHFTTAEAMADLDAVREAIGAERINLVGMSYGTRAGLDYLRQFPARVRRAVLDGVAPPDMALPASFSTDGQAALDALLGGCERDDDCRRRHPRLRQQWETLLEGLPREVRMDDPVTGEPQAFRLTRAALLQAVRGPLYAPTLAAALPVAIESAAAGRWQGVAGLASVAVPPRRLSIALGMHYAVICAEDLPRLESARDAPGRDFGSIDADLYRRVCEGWPRAPLPDGYYTVPMSPAPVLLLSGGLDPATPPRHGERVARALGPLARHVVVPNAGHGVLGVGCMPDVLYRYLQAEGDAAAAQIDAGCAASVPRPSFFAPVQPARAAP